MGRVAQTGGLDIMMAHPAKEQQAVCEENVESAHRGRCHALDMLAGARIQ